MAHEPRAGASERHADVLKLAAVRPLRGVVLVLLVLAGLAPLGATGVAQAAPAAIQPLYAIRAGQTLTVYVVAAAPCGDRTCDVLYQTSNGTRFTRTGAPPILDAESVDLTDFAFATSSNGIAVEATGFTRIGQAAGGTAAYLTTDGGARWKRIAIPGIVRAIATDDGGYLALAGSCASEATCGTLRLEVAGAGPTLVWHAVGVVHDLEPEVSLAADGPHVWVDGVRSRRVPTPVLLSSSDGGRTYLGRVVHLLDGVVPGALSATSASSLWARVPTGSLVAFFHSADGGAAWSPLRVGITSNTGGTAFDPVAGDLAYLAHGESTNELFRITGVDTVTKIAKFPTVQTDALVFVTLREGLAVGNTSSGIFELLETVDGGRHWSRASL